jgi:N4-(beta-N-acetylglucosaminyl)-L-asparaginase
MRAGMSPADACREALQHLVRLRGDAIRGEQVGFLALSAAGEVGAFALLPGFTYAVTDGAGKTSVLPADHLMT